MLLYIDDVLPNAYSTSSRGTRQSC